MALERIEVWWIRMGIVLLVLFFSVVVVDAALTVRGTPSGMRTIDSAKVSTTKPFDKPGITSRDGDTIHVAIVAFMFGFKPSVLEIPVGSTVHFQIASTDVVHGFIIPGRTNVNAMVLPGHVTEVTQRFDEKGRFLVLCSEYCGVAHERMTMYIDVVGKDA